MHASLLLQATTTLTVATGIANIYRRDPLAMELGANALAEAFDGRFPLGLGVSHAPQVSSRGHDYAAPVTTMPNYANNLRDPGYTDDDLDDAGSDRLVDDIVAWGSPDISGSASTRTSGLAPTTSPCSCRPAISPPRSNSSARSRQCCSTADHDLLRTLVRNRTRRTVRRKRRMPVGRTEISAHRHPVTSG